MRSEVAIICDAKAEIVGLHDFFTRWFGGLSQDRREFARCERALHADFTMVTPDGSLCSRDRTLERIREGHGAAGPSFAIRIEDVEPLWHESDAILVAYVEVQSGAGRTTRRRSSALLTRSGSDPAGLVWRHLHETWMQVSVASGCQESRKRGEHA